MSFHNPQPESPRPEGAQDCRVPVSNVHIFMTRGAESPEVLGLGGSSGALIDQLSEMESRGRAKLHAAGAVKGRPALHATAKGSLRGWNQVTAGQSAALCVRTKVTEGALDSLNAVTISIF